MVSAGELFLPRECLVCGRRLVDGERFLCVWCEAGLPLTGFWNMSHNPMADRYNARIEELECGAAETVASHSGEEGSGMGEDGVRLQTLQRYEWATALFYYSDTNGYGRLTQSLKYHGDLQSGRFFARMLGERLAAQTRHSDVAAVLPVPLHWTRRWRRGYNQAEVIAGCVAGAMGAPMRADILRRVRRTETQTKMSVGDKVQNVSGAFEATPCDMIGCHVLVVDDVFTTGATLCACHSALRIAGFSGRISVATLAFVG